MFNWWNYIMLIDTCHGRFSVGVAPNGATICGCKGVTCGNIWIYVYISPSLKTILNWLNTQMVCMTFLAQDIECKDSFECADGLVCRNDKCEDGKI